MLVLSRRETESVLLVCSGTEVKITVKEIGRSRVRLAIDAPRDVVVIRNELLERESDEREQES